MAQAQTAPQPLAEHMEPESAFTHRQMMIGGIIFGVVAVLMLALAYIVLFVPRYHGDEFDPPRDVSDVTMQRVDGGMFHMSDYKGDLVLVYFGYTSCPDICPASLYDLSRLKNEIDVKWLDDFTVVFVSIDPETDTPDKIDDYLTYFDENFIGVYGTHAELEPLYDRFGVEILSPDETIPGYGYGHTGSTFVVDRHGMLRLEMHYGETPFNMAHDLTWLFKEKADSG